MFAARQTAIPSRNADHMAMRARRVPAPEGFSRPTVAGGKSPSTD